ncbi:hypothetical protein KEM52_003162 [Ascosphaera acerosa]|nr:hypothetical protein KEM52_003162 [Ascosphaera acerosa]
MSDILWFDPASQKYSRINKNGIINRSSVNDIKWVPGSENLFVAAMDDGELIVFDKEREDVPFVSEEIELDGAPSSFGLTAMAAGGAAQYGGPGSPDIRAHDTSQGTSDAPRSPVMVGFAPGTTAGEPPSLSTSPLNDLATLRSKFRILKSVSSPHQTKNPVAVYKLSHLSVTQLAFSPDNRHLAVVLEDCTLRIIDFLAEEQLDIFHAYYGGLNCVAWSPDGKYLVTGGQDDLVTIWSMREKRLVARCQGHTSFVRAVAFDPFRCECEKGEYRFGSVGDDCRLLLWDFSPAMVHRPKHQTHRHRNSTITAASHHQPTLSLSLTQTMTHNDVQRRPVFTVNHPVEKRSATAQLPPILSKKVSDDPLYSIVFFEHGIMTSSLEGHIRTWDRCSHDAMSPQQQAQPQSPAPLSPTMQPPRKPSAAISAVMSDGGEVPFANHNWNASGIQTNMWNDASGWKSREDRLGSQSTGQASLQSNLSPSQSRA